MLSPSPPGLCHFSSSSFYFSSAEMKGRGGLGLEGPAPAAWDSAVEGSKTTGSCNSGDPSRRYGGPSADSAAPLAAGQLIHPLCLPHRSQEMLFWRIFSRFGDFSEGWYVRSASALQTFPRRLHCFTCFVCPHPQQQDFSVR